MNFLTFSSVDSGIPISLFENCIHATEPSELHANRFKPATQISLHHKKHTFQKQMQKQMTYILSSK